MKWFGVIQKKLHNYLLYMIKTMNIIKYICLISALAIIVLVIILLGENYETIDKINQGAITKVEVKSFFGKKLSEATLNSQGFYDGEFQNWHLFKKNMIRSKGQFKNGFWHGPWKDYKRDGSLAMIRVWEKGELVKLFMPESGYMIEVIKDKWPEYVDVQQPKPTKAQKI